MTPNGFPPSPQDDESSEAQYMVAPTTGAGKIPAGLTYTDEGEAKEVAEALASWGLSVALRTVEGGQILGSEAFESDKGEKPDMSDGSTRRARMEEAAKAAMA